MNGQGELFRDEGIARAVQHADRVVEEWSSHADCYAMCYINRCGSEPFTATSLRYWVESLGLPSPPDARAWGGVMAKLRKAGLIRPMGFAKNENPLAHCRPTQLWQGVKHP